ncbi:MAG: type I methionyl aminopeptidase [Acetobacteraceae bacterium]|nr:type I methionyl aminopeptidase [Acetobacteraceae bacterium]
MILLKSEQELGYLREAGRIVAESRRVLEDAVRPGVTTAELDELAEKFIRSRGAQPAFKGYRGFPGSICTSVNDEVVHGIPGPRGLKAGDIISIDLGVVYRGYYGDAAFTLPVGEVSPEARRLLQVTEEALWRGIEQARPHRRLSDISWAVQSYVEANGFSVVRDYVGHGIGVSMHEEPQVPNFGPPGLGPELVPGMTLAIEPMVNQGGPEVVLDPDQWTVRTRDGGLSAHFEHTVAVTPRGPWVLTLL